MDMEKKEKVVEGGAYASNWPEFGTMSRQVRTQVRNLKSLLMKEHLVKQRKQTK
jgi:hypothetical protein